MGLIMFDYGPVNDYDRRNGANSGGEIEEKNSYFCTLLQLGGFQTVMNYSIESLIALHFLRNNSFLRRTRIQHHWKTFNLKNVMGKWVS